MTAPKSLPDSRLGRFAQLAKTGVKTGAGLLLARDQSSAAQQAAEVLGQMRALAAKAGQMASYVDGVVPTEHREAWETAMKSLRNAAATSPPAVVRLAVEEELRAPIDRLFAQWEDSPFASASIGQVHRAALPDGTPVAVKVQHPGIRKAMEADLANASVIEAMVGAVSGGRFKSKEQFAVIKARFLEELDYSLEATRIERFQAIHAGEPRITIPGVFRSHSGPRVLTTAFAGGLSFDQACTASPAQRRAWAETMWRFVFRGNLTGGIFNADPHPGNYIFRPGGEVAFIDFGCAQEIPTEHLVLARRIHRAALEGDRPTFEDAAVKLIGMREGRLRPRAISYMYRCFAPIYGSPYRITHEYAGELMWEMKRITLDVLKMPKDETFPMPPDMLFMNRLQFGFYSVLARLDVDVDYAAVERSFLPEFERLDLQK